MVKPLITVAVTCYNHEAYVSDALTSIFKQTYSNIELIVLNDGSTDCSDEVIKNKLVESPFDSTQYYYQDNQGVVFARNRLLKLATGDYIIFVDSDDKIEENYVEALVKTALNHQADIVYTKMVNLETQEVVMPLKDFSLQEFYRGNFIHASSLISRKRLGETTYDEALNRKKLEDYDFFLKLILVNGYRAYPCVDTFLNYRVLTDSRSHHRDKNQYLEDYTAIISKYASYHPDLVAEVMRDVILNLSKLDIEASIQQEQLQIAFEIDGEFIEQESLRSTIRKSNQLEFFVPNHVKRIKVSPSNIPSFYKSFKLVINYYNTALKPSETNGHLFSDSYIFSTFYPFIIYDVTAVSGQVFSLKYDRFNISDITSEDYIATELVKQIEKEKFKLVASELSYQSLKRQLEDLREDYQRLEQERQHYFQSYHHVIGSRRWRIPSKLLDKIRRK